MNRSSASNASARYATVRERNAVLDHCPVDRMMQQDLNTGRYSSNRAQVKGMNVANAPTSKQPTEAGIVAEGLSLQVREVLMNIENLRSYHWTKIESLEGMLECGDLQLPDRPVVPPGFIDLDAKTATKPGGALYEKILAAGEEAAQLGCAMSYFQKAKCVIEHHGKLATMWREFCESKHNAAP